MVVLDLINTKKPNVTYFFGSFLDVHIIEMHASRDNKTAIELVDKWKCVR